MLSMVDSREGIPRNRFLFARGKVFCMIGPKGFFALAIPLTLSVYSLLLNIFVPDFQLVSIWISASLTAVFCIVSALVLLRLSENEEEKLVSDHMNMEE